MGDIPRDFKGVQLLVKPTPPEQPEAVDRIEQDDSVDGDVETLASVEQDGTATAAGEAKDYGRLFSDLADRLQLWREARQRELDKFFGFGLTAPASSHANVTEPLIDPDAGDVGDVV
jgi:hypothetical protein